MAVAIDILADEIYRMVADGRGKTPYKAGDLSKAMIRKFGAQNCANDDCRRAVRLLIDSGRCVWSYYGGNFLTLPHRNNGWHR